MMVIEITLRVNILGLAFLLKIFDLARIIIAATQIVKIVRDEDIVSHEHNEDDIIYEFLDIITADVKIVANIKQISEIHMYDLVIVGSRSMDISITIIFSILIYLKILIYRFQ